MKILSIGNFWKGWDGSICDEEHIAKALEELGHTVFRYSREELRDGVKKFDFIGDTTLDIDFALIAQWDQYPDLSWLKVPKVYWAFDYQNDGQEWHERLIAESDLYLSKRISDSKYPNWRWLAQDFAPTFLHRKGIEEKDIDVLFTGTYLPIGGYRREILQELDKQFNLQVYSITPNEWREVGLKNVHNAIVDEGLPELVGRAKVNISVDIWCDDAGYWSDRNAQIMACGGMVLFKHIPMSEARFGDNIAYAYSPQDFIEKTRYYLNNRQEREDLAHRGYLYAIDNLMVRNRVKDLLTIVGEIL